MQKLSFPVHKKAPASGECGGWWSGCDVCGVRVVAVCVDEDVHSVVALCDDEVAFFGEVVEAGGGFREGGVFLFVAGVVAVVDYYEGVGGGGCCVCHNCIQHPSGRLVK